MAKLKPTRTGPTLGQEVIALAILGSGILLLLALFSFDPRDLSFYSNPPPKPQSQPRRPSRRLSRWHSLSSFRPRRLPLSRRLYRRWPSSLLRQRGPLLPKIHPSRHSSRHRSLPSPTRRPCLWTFPCQSPLFRRPRLRRRPLPCRKNARRLYRLLSQR